MLARPSGVKLAFHGPTRKNYACDSDKRLQVSEKKRMLNELMHSLRVLQITLDEITLVTAKTNISYNNYEEMHLRV